MLFYALSCAVLSALALEVCLGLLHGRDVEVGNRFRGSSPAWRSDAACGFVHPSVAQSPFMFLEVQISKGIKHLHIFIYI